jgi:glycyl-tRNA synthetase
MNKVISLCKRRGFVFQSSEIYGGLKSCYDFGPLGVELKRNIAQAWWHDMVQSRDNIYGIDASILMHPKVWQASGHLDNFSDPLVDCLNCRERFRADKAPRYQPGEEVTAQVKTRNNKTEEKQVTVGACGYVCPHCHSSQLSPERLFHGMFRTSIGSLDPINELIEHYDEQAMSKEDFRKYLITHIEKSAVYLRPETAQAMFVQFLNVQQTMAAKVPFGIAQQGKSFRNEIVVEHFIFRSCEFEQMEMEFFCEPGTQQEWMHYWKQERMRWHQKYANHKDHYRFRQHDDNELAHYSDSCFDVEYLYPWGWDELEGIASRTDYDLKQHSKASGSKLTYFDPQKINPETGKAGWRYTPYVIEPAAGLTRTFLCYLLDAYHEEESTDAAGESKKRTVLKLHPALAPIKAAIFPLVKKDGQPEMAQKIAQTLRALGLAVSYDDNQSIGKRYAKHDEIGTPYCLTIDNESLTDQHITIRHRDSTLQQRLPVEEAIALVKKLVRA